MLKTVNPDYRIGMLQDLKTGLNEHGIFEAFIKKTSLDEAYAEYLPDLKQVNKPEKKQSRKKSKSNRKGRK